MDGAPPDFHVSSSPPPFDPAQLANDMDDQLPPLEDRLATLEEELEEFRQASDQAWSQVETEKETIYSQMDALSDRITEAAERVEHHEVRISRLEQEVEELKARGRCRDIGLDLAMADQGIRVMKLMGRVLALEAKERHREERQPPEGVETRHEDPLSRQPEERDSLRPRGEASSTRVQRRIDMHSGRERHARTRQGGSREIGSSRKRHERSSPPYRYEAGSHPRQTQSDGDDEDRYRRRHR